MKALQVIRSAYRCTIEEQDDPAVWIARAMKGAGADLGVLLRGNAVSYAVRGQDASGLSFGGRPQTRPPRMDHEVEAIVAGGTPVYFVREDLEARGIEEAALVSGVRALGAAELPALLEEYDQVWHW